MKNTTARQPSEELKTLGYSNEHQNYHVDADKDLLFKLRRDYFLDNLYISKWCKENFDYEEDYSIYIINSFEETFITLEQSHWNIPNRVAVDADGEVRVSSGNDEPFFTPCLDLKGECWEHHDDELWVAGFLDINDEGYYVADKKYCKSHYHWTTCVCIPDVLVYGLGDATKDLIVEKFGLGEE